MTWEDRFLFSVSEYYSDFSAGAIHKLEFLSGKDGHFYLLLTHFNGGNIKIKVAFFKPKYLLVGSDARWRQQPSEGSEDNKFYSSASHFVMT